MSVACWAMREAAAGVFTAQAAVTELRTAFIAAMVTARTATDRVLDPASAAAEADSVLAWAVAQAQAEAPEIGTQNPQNPTKSPGIEGFEGAFPEPWDSPVPLPGRTDTIPTDALGPVLGPLVDAVGVAGSARCSTRTASAPRRPGCTGPTRTTIRSGGTGSAGRIRRRPRARRTWQESRCDLRGRRWGGRCTPSWSLTGGPPGALLGTPSLASPASPSQVSVGRRARDPVGRTPCQGGSLPDCLPAAETPQSARSRPVAEVSGARPGSVASHFASGELCHYT